MRTEEDERNEEGGWESCADGREEGGEERGGSECKEKVPVDAVFRDVFLVGHPLSLAFVDLEVRTDGRTG